MANIIINENISSGAPTVSGRRLTVCNVITKVYIENDILVAMDDYEINEEIIKDAVNYCSGRECQKDVMLVKFCSGCILRTLQDGYGFDKKEFSSFSFNQEDEVFTVSKNFDRIFLGSMQELEDQEFGIAGWIIASKIKNKYKDIFDGNTLKW